MDVAVQLVASQLVTGVLSMSMDAKVPLNAAPWFKTTENQGFNSKRASWPPRARTRKTVYQENSVRFAAKIILLRMLLVVEPSSTHLFYWVSTPQNAIEW